MSQLGCIRQEVRRYSRHLGNFTVPGTAVTNPYSKLPLAKPENTAVEWYGVVQFFLNNTLTKEKRKPTFTFNVTCLSFVGAFDMLFGVVLRVV